MTHKGIQASPLLYDEEGEDPDTEEGFDDWGDEGQNEQVDDD